MTFNLDWSSTNLDGSNTVSSGSDTIGVSVSTPKNHDYDQWSLKDGVLYSSDVCKDTTATVTFDDEVSNVSFTIHDVDCFDEVKVYAKDADGNLVPVTFENTGNHVINGASVIGKGATNDGPGSDTTYDISVSIEGPVSELIIIHDDTGSSASGGNSGSVAVSDITFGLAGPEGDGIVSGTGGDDLIDVSYTGDPEGDMIDNNDALIGNVGSNDDIVVAGDGDDTVIAGEGDDEVYGNGGSDTIYGGDGDDTLIGDDGGAYGNGAGAGTSTQEVFKWSDLDDKYGGSLQDGEKITSQTQDTGENTVTLTLDTSHDNVFSTDQQKVHSIDTGELPGANPYSSLESELDYKGDSETYTLEFDKDAENVSFRVNDIDFDSTVVITAYDADGNEVPVNITAGSGVDLYDNDGVAGYETAVSKGGGAPDTSPNYSGLVSIPGPVAKIVITHTQDGHHDSGVNVTDIYFDTVTESDGSGEAGNDVIFGGAGDDYIEGNGGEDTLDGGEGADTVLGGDDADTIIGGAGDVVDGGAGGDDNDTLDLTLGEPFYLKDLEPDSNGNGWNGTVVYVDADGKPTGETMTFTEIENINGTPANQLPVAGDDVAKGDILNPVTIDVLGNDTDPDGDTLTIDSITQPAAGGTVVDNGDGTVTFTPDGTVDGDVTFEYTVTDGKGGFDTATVTVTLRDGIVEGTAGNDYIDEDYTGDPEGDMVDAGDNIFGGGPDDDIIDAGAGDDTVKAGLGDDTVYGGDGNDAIYGRGGNDTLDGGAGDDYIEGGQNDDTITGGDGNDTIFGQGGNDNISGGAGNDTIRGGMDADVIDGGDGDDTIDGMSGDDTITGGAGNDYIFGGGGEDYIDGGAGDDELIGHNSADTIIGGDGSDYVEGGGSDDYIDTSGNIHPVTGLSGSPDQGYPGIFVPDADPNDDKDTVYGGDGNDTIITGDDDDYIEGGNGNDTINAGYDDDTVFGGNGDDYIVGGEGNDTIDGGAGDDTIYGGLDPIFPDVLNIPDDEGDLRPDNGDDVIHGGAGNDTIYGQDDDDLIYGDEGDDTIDGGVDDDTIYGGTGNDTIIGGEGEDALFGEDDRDTFIGGNAGDHVDGGDGGDDYDTLNLTGSDVDYIEYTSPDREDGIVHFNGGGTMTFEEIENVIPCFTPGTLIATPRGEVAVEELKVGDKVITRDNGIQEIRWLGRTDVDTVELMKRPALRPVRIAQGALGNNLPERDMLVSPQHRVLVASDRAALYFEEREVLVAAKHLVNGEGIAEAADVASVSYIHFMFDQHEVVLSDGAWTESFQPGDYTLEGLDTEQREELLALFPELKEKEGRAGYTAARKTLKKHEALLLSE